MKALKALFIPLRAVHFAAFKAGTKSVEWRAFGPRFNERTLISGRAVVLSKGYNGERLHGTITGCEFRRVDEVEGASAIYGTFGRALIGIHIRLTPPPARTGPRQSPPRGRRPGRNS